MVYNHSFEDEEPIPVSRKGVVTIINFSEKRGKLDLMSYLTECISKTPMKKVLAHKKCCRDFTDIKEGFKSYESSPDVKVPCPKRLCSQESQFNWKDDCMFCGKRALVDPRHPEELMHTVTTLHYDERLEIGRSSRLCIWSKCSHTYDVRESSLKGFAWTFLARSCFDQQAVA